MYRLFVLIHAPKVGGIDWRTDQVGTPHRIQRFQGLGRVQREHVVPLQEVVPDDIPSKLLFLISGGDQIEPRVPVDNLAALAVLSYVADDGG